MASEGTVELSRAQVLEALLEAAQAQAEAIRDESSDDYERTKADSIARQLRELVKEAKELS